MVQTHAYQWIVPSAGTFNEQCCMNLDMCCLVAPVHMNQYTRWTQPHTPMQPYASHALAYLPNACMPLISRYDLPPCPHRALKRIKIDFSMLLFLNCPTLSYCPCHVTSPLWLYARHPILISPNRFMFCTCSPPPFHIWYLFLLSHVLFCGGIFELINFNK